MVTINCSCGNSYVFDKNNAMCTKCGEKILAEFIPLFENIDLCSLELNYAINKRSSEGLCQKIKFTID